jgi:hypothetical protein
VEGTAGLTRAAEPCTARSPHAALTFSTFLVSDELANSPAGGAAKTEYAIARAPHGARSYNGFQLLAGKDAGTVSVKHPVGSATVQCRHTARAITAAVTFIFDTVMLRH